MATTKYGNQYASSDGTFQVYITHSVEETASNVTITADYYTRAITRVAPSILSWSMKFRLRGSNTGEYEIDPPTWSAGHVVHNFTRTLTIAKDTSAKTWSVTFWASNDLIPTGSSSDSSTVSQSVSIPALQSWNVTYNANGGSGAPSTQKKYYGKTLTLSSTVPTRSGYTFVGWNTSSTATTAKYSAGGSYTGNAALALYAIWKKTITITYNANGGSGAPSNQSATVYNSTTSYKFTLASTKPTRTGYTFLGWATSSSATTASYQPGAQLTRSSSVTLYAVWKIVTYTITYNANGGSGTVASQSKNYGASVTLSNGSGFSRTNYDLVEWNTAADGSGTAYNKSSSYTKNANLTLYAQWQRSYIKPMLNGVKAYRVASPGSSTETDDGQYIRIEASYTPGSDGTTYLASTLTIEIDGASVYSQTISAGSGPGAMTPQTAGTYSPDAGHLVTVTIADSRGSASYSVDIATAIYPIDLYVSGTDVYMGVMHPYVAGQALTLTETNVDGDIRVALDTTSTSGMDYEIYSALQSLGWDSDVIV